MEVMRLFQNIKKSTILFALFIVISASFNRQILDLFRTLFKDRIIEIFIWGLMFFGFIGLFKKYYFKIKSLGFLRIFCLLLLIALVFIFALQLHIVQERIHILFFTALGFLASNDLIKGTENVFILFLLALIFCFITVMLDEIFQYFLPYRWYDIRDIWTGMLSSFIGVLFCLVFEYKRVSFFYN